MYETIKYLFNHYIGDPVKCYLLGLNEYKHLKKLILSKKSEDLIDKLIVFNVVRPIRDILDTELFLGLILALHGAKVKILLDDGILAHWDTRYYVGDTPNHRKYRTHPFNLYYFNYFDVKNYIREYLGGNYLGRRIIKKALKTYNHENIEYIRYSEMINKKNINYSNLDGLEEHAESSTIKFFRTEPINYEDPFVEYIYKLSLLNSVLGREIGDYILNVIKPDYYLCEHAIYSTWGPTYHYLNNRGVKCYVWCGLNTHTPNFTDTYFADVPAQNLTASEMWKQFREKDLTPDMISKVDKLMQNRLKGNVVDLMNYMGKERSIIKVDKDKDYQYHICMFPNLIWDGNLREKHLVFNGYIDWILSTINLLKNNDKIKLYVKAHPAELKDLKGTDRILDLVKKNIETSTITNLELIPPEKKVDTYKFIKSGLDLALVYDGFLAVELTYLGIPAILSVKDGFSSVEGATIIVNSKEEYSNYLINIEKTIQDFKNNFKKYKTTITKWLYWYAFENTIPLPTVRYLRKDGRINLLRLRTKDLNLSNNMKKLFI